MTGARGLRKHIFKKMNSQMDKKVNGVIYLRSEVVQEKAIAEM
jgi:hypothetical protein